MLAWWAFFFAHEMPMKRLASLAAQAVFPNSETWLR
jgi:hypothetical protein